MSKLNCNIIKDLLPSYLEDICSQDTKDAVDGHLAECSKCRSLAKMMHETDFVSGRTEYLEIDYMKKVKKRLITKSSAACLLLAAAVVCGLISLVRDGHGYRPVKFYCLLLPVFLAATGVLLADLNQKMDKAQKIMTALGAALAGYGMLIMTLAASKWHFGIGGGELPFSLKPQTVGPLLFHQFLAIALLQAAMYLYGLYQVFRGKDVNFLRMGIHLTGACTMLSQMNWIRNLSEPSNILPEALQTAVMPVLTGTVVIICIQLIFRWKARDKR